MAAEIVIILTISAVEKVLLKLDVVYDALTSLDKIGHVLDLPVLRPRSGTELPLATTRTGLRVELRHLQLPVPRRPPSPGAGRVADAGTRASTWAWSATMARAKPRC